LRRLIENGKRGLDNRGGASEIAGQQIKHGHVATHHQAHILQERLKGCLLLLIHFTTSGGLT
jgi:hypothetical protein